MSSETSIDTKPEGTEPQAEVSKNPSQDVESTKQYTQEQVDAIAAEIRRKSEAKVSKKFEGVDVEHYHSLLDKEEQEKLQKQKEKGEFEKILKEQAEKASSKITQLTSELTKIKVDGALLNSAASNKAISPEQVVRLVRDQVKMSEAGEVEIIDPKTNAPRYTETGDPMTVDGLVSDFLKTNPHFVTAGPAGGGSKSNTSSEGAKQVDIAKLDLNKAEDREAYRQWRRSQGYKSI